MDQEREGEGGRRKARPVTWDSAVGRDVLGTCMEGTGFKPCREMMSLFPSSVGNPGYHAMGPCYGSQETLWHTGGRQAVKASVWAQLATHQLGASVWKSDLE